MPEYATHKEIFEIDIDKTLNDLIILRLLETASRYIGEVNNIVSNVLEFDFIISALKNIESLNSARIEGTTGNLKDLYLEDALEFEKKKQLKLFGAINYKAVMVRLEDIVRQHREIDKGLILKLHKLLTRSDPATQGIPGEFRTKEVIVRNSKLGNFYPAFPVKVEEYINEYVRQNLKNRAYPTLINAAISHYQFEAIHPFEDGNGRTGRLLIAAGLLLEGTINTGILNLSQYFDKNRDEYLYSLRSVSDKRDYGEWVSFFLNAIIEQCKHNIKLIGDLRKIKEDNELLINQLVQSPGPGQVLNHALNRLYITTTDTVEFLRKKRMRGDLEQLARNSIKRLVGLGILEKTPFKQGRAISYAHRDLKKKLMG